jgi:hypothetical protein
VAQFRFLDQKRPLRTQPSLLLPTIHHIEHSFIMHHRHHAPTIRLLPSLLAFILTLFTLSAHTNAQNQCEGDKSTPGYCTILSATDLTLSTPSPPTVAQCMSTCHNTLSDAGDWIVDFTGQPEGYIDHMSVSPGGCSFSVGRAPGVQEMDFKFYMHNQDIVDVLVSERSSFFLSLDSGCLYCF